MAVTVRTFAENGVEIKCESTRVWKGEDATYLVMTVAGHMPLPNIAQPIHTTVGGQIFIVREVVADMRTTYFTVSCVDRASWDKQMRLPLVRPPSFSSLEEADRWLERQGR